MNTEQHPNAAEIRARLKRTRMVSFCAGGGPAPPPPAPAAPAEINGKINGKINGYGPGDAVAPEPEITADMIRQRLAMARATTSSSAKEASAKASLTADTARTVRLKK